MESKKVIRLYDLGHVVCLGHSMSLLIPLVVPERNWRRVQRTGWHCEVHPQSVPLSSQQTPPRESLTGEWGSAWTWLTWGTKNIRRRLFKTQFGPSHKRHQLFFEFKFNISFAVSFFLEMMYYVCICEFIVLDKKHFEERFHRQIKWQ